jgi:HK97 family phage prohead protease
MTNKKMKFTAGHLKAYEEGDDVIIEGYANFSAPDGVKERMDPMSARLERFTKNPQLLFNHDMDFPFGSVPLVEKRKDGVWCRAKVTKSTSSEKANYLRDLVREGSLRTFSIRFADEEWEADPMNPGVRLAKNWELQEVSIVSIPMQADSTFTLSGAKFLNNCKSLNEARQEVLRMKGANVARVISSRISEMEKQDGWNKEEVVDRICQQGGCDRGQWSDILAGEVTPVSEGVLGAVSGQLSIPLEELHAAQAEDVGDDGKAKPPAEGNPPADPAVPPPAPADPKADPAASGDPMETALQECVRAKVPLLIQEGNEPEQAVALAMSQCSEEKGCDIEVGKKFMTDFLKYAIEEEEKAKQANQGAKTDPNTVPVDNPPKNENEHLELLKQMVSTMGALSTEMRGLREDFQKAMNMGTLGAPPPPADPAAPPADPEKGAGEPKNDPEKAMKEAQERRLLELEGRIKALTDPEN